MAGKLIADNWENGDGTENYKCRAWINFNGTGTVAIRAAKNVSSLTDNGTGDYTLNFASALSDSNYAVASSVANATSATISVLVIKSAGITSLPDLKTTTQLRIITNTGAQDIIYGTVTIHGS